MLNFYNNNKNKYTYNFDPKIPGIKVTGEHFPLIN